MYSEALPVKGRFGQEKMEVDKIKGTAGEEGRYEEVDSGTYLDMGVTENNNKDYYENYDFGENGIYQNILFKAERRQLFPCKKQKQNVIKRNKSLRIACGIDEKSELNKESFERLLTPSSLINLKDWNAEEETGSKNDIKAKTLFSSKTLFKQCPNPHLGPPEITVKCSNVVQSIYFGKPNISCHPQLCNNHQMKNSGTYLQRENSALRRCTPPI